MQTSCAIEKERTSASVEIHRARALLGCLISQRGKEVVNSAFSQSQSELPMHGDS